MKILITGASGYVGKNLLKELNTDHKLIVFCRADVEGNFELIKGDLRSFDDVKNAVNGVDLIIHLAAVTPKVENLEGSKLIDINVKGTYHILEAAQKAKVTKIIYASSINAVGYDHQKLPIKENTTCIPNSGTYGVSKYLGEQLCRNYSRMYNLDIICLRFGIIFPDNKIIHPPAPYSHPWFCYVDIKDVITAIKLSVKQKIKFGIFHITAQNSYSRYDISQAKKVLGYSPEHNFKELFPEIYSFQFINSFMNYVKGKIR